MKHYLQFWGLVLSCSTPIYLTMAVDHGWFRVTILYLVWFGLTAVATHNYLKNYDKHRN